MIGFCRQKPGLLVYSTPDFGATFCRIRLQVPPENRGNNHEKARYSLNYSTPNHPRRFPIGTQPDSRTFPNRQRANHTVRHRGQDAITNWGAEKSADCEVRKRREGAFGRPAKRDRLAGTTSTGLDARCSSLWRPGRSHASRLPKAPLVPNLEETKGLHSDMLSPKAPETSPSSGRSKSTALIWFWSFNTATSSSCDQRTDPAIFMAIRIPTLTPAASCVARLTEQEPNGPVNCWSR